MDHGLWSGDWYNPRLRSQFGVKDQASTGETHRPGNGAGRALVVGTRRSTETFALPVSPMSDVTRILSAIEQGDPLASEKLLPLVYDELRTLAAAKLAQEKPGPDTPGHGPGS